MVVKNPVNPDLDLWVGALERLNRAGIRKLGVIHRGAAFTNKQPVCFLERSRVRAGKACTASTVSALRKTGR